VEFHGNQVKRGEQKRADYLLRYTRDFPIAVVEAKPEGDPAGKGMQQAKEYTEIFGLKFAYATNGKEILEFDYLTGQEQEISAYPTPTELFARLRQAEGLSDDVVDTLWRINFWAIKL
jgi:type I restriction enzyme R subunit